MTVYNSPKHLGKKKKENQFLPFSETGNTPVVKTQTALIFSRAVSQEGSDLNLLTIVYVCRYRGSYRVLLKSTCAFFSHSWLFLSCNFLKSAFILAKMCFFSVEPPIFS